MRSIKIVVLGVFVASSVAGCFVSRKETIREVPASTTTLERRSTVETVPDGDVVRRRSTTETIY